MSKVISISEAASIAMHSMVLIARSEEKMNVMKIAEATGASRHHVAKIMQRLVKDGYLQSNRGPNGGFVLKIDPAKISLLNIYETIEGKIDIATCPMDNPICPFDKCLMGNVVTKMTNNFKDYMSSQILSDYLTD